MEHLGCSTWNICARHSASENGGIGCVASELARYERRTDGTFGPGNHASPRGAAGNGKRRILKSVERMIGEPFCAETIAEGLVEAMLSPDDKPVAAKIAFDRVWPVVGKHEITGPAGGPIEILGVDERLRLARYFDAEISEGEILDLEPDPGRTGKAEAD